jgi:translation elongation factor EF-Tu-like GTPase
MTTPPLGQDWPQLWMTISDVFHIRGRGTVVTGRLEGNGYLSVGDRLICDGQRWQIDGIEQFRAVLSTAEPGSDIGVMLGNGPSADALRGRTVQFEVDAARGPESQFTVLPPKKKRWRH